MFLKENRRSDVCMESEECKLSRSGQKSGEIGGERAVCTSTTVYLSIPSYVLLFSLWLFLEMDGANARTNEWYEYRFGRDRAKTGG